MKVNHNHLEASVSNLSWALCSICFPLGLRVRWLTKNITYKHQQTYCTVSTQQLYSNSRKCHPEKLNTQRRSSVEPKINRTRQARGTRCNRVFSSVIFFVLRQAQTATDYSTYIAICNPPGALSVSIKGNAVWHRCEWWDLKRVITGSFDMILSGEDLNICLMYAMNAESHLACQKLTANRLQLKAGFHFERAQADRSNSHS